MAEKDLSDIEIEELSRIEKYVLISVLAWMTGQTFVHPETGEEIPHEYPVGKWKPRLFCEHFRCWPVTDEYSDDELRDAIQALQQKGLLKTIRLFKRDLDWGLTEDGRGLAYDVYENAPPTEGNELVAHRFITEWRAEKVRRSPGSRYADTYVFAVQPQLMSGPIEHPETGRKYDPKEIPSADVIEVRANLWFFYEVITSAGDYERIASKIEQVNNWQIHRDHPTKDERPAFFRFWFKDWEIGARVIHNLAKDDAFRVPAAPLDGDLGNYRYGRLNEIVNEARREGRFPVYSIAVLPKSWSGPHKKPKTDEPLMDKPPRWEILGCRHSG